MDVTEVRSLKWDLENEIALLLQNFEKQSGGMTISKIEMDRGFSYTGGLSINGPIPPLPLHVTVEVHI